MVACFSATFCAGTASAARGKYTRAAPLLVAGLIIIAGGVLGAHFFAEFSDTYHGTAVHGPNSGGLPLSVFANHTFPVAGNFIYLADGHIVRDILGEAQWCKHKLPIVNSCINE